MLYQNGNPSKSHNAAMGNAGSVPNVPGAFGASPLPKPKPSQHTGCLQSQSHVGVTGGGVVSELAKMIESLML